MNSKLLIFGSENFNNSFKEIKEYLEFSLIFFEFNKPLLNISESVVGIIVDNEICKEKNNLKTINKFSNKPILLLHDINLNDKNIFNNKILLPISLLDLKNKIINMVVSSKFTLNSSIKIKDYILNKNEKSLTKLNLSISLTEREVQLVELLFKEKKSLSRNFILQKIWKYSKDVDSHTVETHVYRLRQKINNKFNDDNFILNSDKGYTI